MIVGMDFGTTNSGMATFDGKQVQLLPLEPANAAAPHVLRTMIYITRGQHQFIGREAIEAYYEQNLGRPIQLQREYVGEIQMTFAEIGSFWRDVYVWVDELEPGRIFRSIKSCLQDKDYVGTSVWGTFYTLEDLVSVFLRLSRKRAERVLGREIEEIVLGRPVKFAHEPQANRLAEERLARAALQAGYKRAYFELEPVAAALSYQQNIPSTQRVLVFDFGGGTLDLTVMELSTSGWSRVLSTGGVRIAGDVFDQRIIRERLARRLGEGVTYGPKDLTLPSYIFEELIDWQTMFLLNRPDVLQFLAEVERTARDTEAIRTLNGLIRNNYALMMFDQVERAKVELSSAKETVIRLSGQHLSLEEPLSRGEFQRIIDEEARQIAACIDQTLADAGLGHEQIDAVVRTGGSSLIPLFQRMLAARFGREIVRPMDEFSSVTAGLGIAAYMLEQGTRPLRSYTSADLSPQPLLRKKPGEGEEKGAVPISRGY